MNYSRIAIALLALTGVALAAMPAHSHNKPKPADPPAVTAKASSDSDSNAYSKSASQSRSDSVSASDSDSSAASNSGGNTQATTTNATTTYTAPKNPVNTAVAGLGETTAKCRYHNGAGLQLAGVGLSFGHSSKDGDCERLELATYLYSRGNDIAGDRVMCAIKAIKDALGADCLALVHEMKAVPTASGHDYVTHDELAERDRREARSAVSVSK